MIIWLCCNMDNNQKKKSDSFREKGTRKQDADSKLMNKFLLTVSFRNQTKRLEHKANLVF